MNDASDSQRQSLGMNAMIGAMTFVVAVRLVLQGVSVVFAYPVFALKGRLPDADRPTFARWERLKTWVVNRALGQLPAWAEYNGGGTILLKTTRGRRQLERLVNCIPERAITAWLQFGIAVMVAFLVGWGALLLAGLVLWAKATGDSILAVVDWAVVFDWGSLLEPRPMPSFDPIEMAVQLAFAIPEMAHGAALLAISLLASIMICWALMLLLLPGLTLHELGHYAAIRRVGGSVDSYGLLLFGPLLGGAFVEPGDDVEDLPTQYHFEILSAGVANSLLWGTALLSCGLILSDQPLTILQALAVQDYGMFTAQPLPSILLVVGIVEVANGFLNAIPIGTVDGGQFVLTAEEEWWGFTDSHDFRDKISHVLSQNRSVIRHE